MFIFAWACIVLGAVVAIGGLVAFVKAVGSSKYDYDRSTYLVGGAVAVVVGVLVAAGSAFWLYGTEAGARAQKSFQSSTGGGLTRVVKVYDMEGDLIDTYEGKFDVDANAERIIFDVPREDGTKKRIQIWSSTGTVTIEEK